MTDYDSDSSADSLIERDTPTNSDIEHEAKMLQFDQFVGGPTRPSIQAIQKKLEELWPTVPKPKVYRYLITFTIKEPENHDPDKIEKYIKDQFLRSALQVNEAYMVRELTKKDVPHWHVACETTKYLPKDRFHYYTQKYGNIDISKTKSQTLKYAINYISKDNEPLKIA